MSNFVCTSHLVGIRDSHVGIFLWLSTSDVLGYVFKMTTGDQNNLSWLLGDV
jgi:hypothetical protein